jgi:hypothetical protein
MRSQLFDSHLQMPFVDRDQIIQAFVAQGPAKALANGICSWRPHWSSQHAHPWRRPPCPDPSTRSCPGRVSTGIDTDGPASSTSRNCCKVHSAVWVGDNVVMEESPGAQFHGHKHIKGAEAYRHDREDVARHNQFSGQNSVTGLTKAMTHPLHDDRVSGLDDILFDSGTQDTCSQ